MLMAPTSARAEIPNDGEVPAEFRHAGVKEHLGDPVPPQISFTSHTGERVSLAQYFDGKRPVLLNFAYHRCPVLCSMVLKATIAGLQGIGWTVGKEFQVLTISIDPKETLSRTADKRKQVIEAYGRGEAEQGWHFLVGTKENIDRATAAVGFEYQYDAEQDQYAHPSAIMLLTPQGRVARYLYGLEFSPHDLRVGLLEASEGRFITTVEQIILYCYHYDPKAGKYVLMATRVMQVGAIITMLVLGSFLSMFWARERRRARLDAEHKPPPPVGMHHPSSARS